MEYLELKIENQQYKLDKNIEDIIQLKEEIEYLKQHIFKQKTKIIEEENKQNIEGTIEEKTVISKPLNNLINLQCRIWFDEQNFLDTTAILDTGSTKSMIIFHLVPIQFQSKNSYLTRTKTVENQSIYLTHNLVTT